MHKARVRANDYYFSLLYNLCRQEFYRPIFVHSAETINYLNIGFLEKYRILHIISASFYEETKHIKECKYIFDKENYEIQIERTLETCILNVEMDDIKNLSRYVLELFNKVNHIELNINNLGPDFLENVYKEELYIILKYLVDEL